MDYLSSTSDSHLFSVPDDFRALCMPHIPFVHKERQKMTSFSVDQKLPLLVSAIMGLQHAFAMVAVLDALPPEWALALESGGPHVSRHVLPFARHRSQQLSEAATGR